MTDRNGLSEIEFSLLAAIRLQGELQNALVDLRGELEQAGSSVTVADDLFTANGSIDDGLVDIANKLNVGIPVEFDRGDEAETAAYLCEEIEGLTEFLPSIDEMIKCGTLTEPMRAELQTTVQDLLKEAQRVVAKIKRK